MLIEYRKRARVSRLCAAVSAVLSLPCAAALAASAAEGQETATLLDTVVVTTEAPVSSLTYVLDPRLPRQPVPASDGADYLKTIPGFTAIRNGGSNGDPVLRGMFGSRLNLVTNDGSMPGACPARMDNPMSYVSPETFDRLIVVKGPQTVLWGPGASAGTVRFERDVEPFTEPGMRGNGSLLFGSFGRNDQVLDATLGSPVAYLRANGNRSASEDYRDGDGEVVPSLWKKWNADVALGWTPDENTLLEFSAGTGDGEARYAGRGMDGSRFKRQSHAIKFERSGFAGALESVQASLFHNYADHVMDNYSLRDPNPMSMMPMPMAANVDRRTQGGRAAVEWQWTQWELTLGADAQDSRHRQRSAMGRGTYRAQPWMTDAEFANLGMFAEAGWTPADAGRWIAGVRMDRGEATDLRETSGMMGMPNPTHGMTRRETLPAGFVRYEGGPGDSPLTWYAGIGHTQRMPDYWELFSADMGPMYAANAFAGIQPERTTQIDMGAQYRSERFDAWISAYAGRMDDYILFTYSTGGMMGSMTSVANVDARVRGAEAGAEWRIGDTWKVGATVAHAWGENRGNGRPLPQMPPLDARMSVAYDNAKWSFGALLRGVSGQNRVAPGQGNVTGQDLGTSSGFGTLALNGGYRFSSKLQLTAGIDNVFDRTYSEHLNLAGSADFGFPADPVRINEPGRTGWLKLNYSY